MSRREQERQAQAYCESIGVDPFEVIKGYWDTGLGRSEWLEAPRWTWYRDANTDWDRPLTGYEKAQVAREMNRARAMGEKR